MSNSNEMTPEEMLLDLDKHYSGKLTEWQELFVANMLEKLDASYQCELPFTPTENQANKIAEIYAERDDEE